MATMQECEKALEGLASELAQGESSTDFERTLSCTVRDLELVLAGRFSGGSFVDIKQTETSTGDIKLSCSSDDLVDLCNGQLNVAKAWASGKLKVDASIGDMMKLRKLLA